MSTFSYTNLPVVGTSTANEAANRIVNSFTQLAAHINGKNVGSDNIEDGAIVTGKLAQGAGVEAVTTACLRASAVTTAKIADYQVSDLKLVQTAGSEAVVTAAIRANAVTPAKVAVTPFVEVVRSTSANLVTTPAEGVAFTWESATVDTGVASGGAAAMWTNSNATRIVLPRDGIYTAQGYISIDNSASVVASSITCTVVRTASSNSVKSVVARDYRSSAWNTGALWVLNPSGVFAASAGDYIELWFRQSGGTAKSVVPFAAPASTTVPGEISPVFRVSWVGKVS